MPATHEKNAVQLARAIMKDRLLQKYVAPMSIRKLRQHFIESSSMGEETSKKSRDLASPEFFEWFVGEHYTDGLSYFLDKIRNAFGYEFTGEFGSNAFRASFSKQWEAALSGRDFIKSGDLPTISDENGG